MKKPTKRQFQYDKPFCLIARCDCRDVFNSVDELYIGCANCSKCKLAIDKLNGEVSLLET